MLSKPRLVYSSQRHTPPRAGSRAKPDLALIAAPLAASAVAVLALLWLNAGLPWPRTATTTFLPVIHGINVVDGDTIRVDGRLTRLTGFNAPEMWKPNCATERSLGEAATARLRRLVDGGAVSFAAVHCSCKPGTEGTAECNYGRACGSLQVDGRDVGSILIAEGLAVGFVCGTTGCPPTPRPWCG